MTTALTSHEPTARPVLDLTKALERVEGDRPLLAELVALFLEECPKLLSGLRSAISRNDAGALTYTAHTFKGSVGNFAAVAAFDAALALERIGRSGDLALAPDALALLEQELDRLQPALAAILQYDTDG